MVVYPFMEDRSPGRRSFSLFFYCYILFLLALRQYGASCASWIPLAFNIHKQKNSFTMYVDVSLLNGPLILVSAPHEGRGQTLAQPRSRRRVSAPTQINASPCHKSGGLSVLRWRETTRTREQ